ncbi:MAG: O-acetyl-ADP-ribose deacetylase [Bacteroidetes bacterium]|nr:MAG: O-acetyl-ADP-ribose deacetylase [Bacteroidota bacterium]
MNNIIELYRGDITKLNVDAIVNAANNSLLGGGGVDGAIHRAAGEELLEECRLLNGCATGDAKVTKGYNLPAKYVIHTVGPIWSGREDDALFLQSCYRKSLDLAVEINAKSIAFPNISTGVYRFPKTDAADIAIETVCQFLNQNNFIEKVIFAVFDDENYQIYKEKIKNL